LGDEDIKTKLGYIKKYTWIWFRI